MWVYIYCMHLCKRTKKSKYLNDYCTWLPYIRYLLHINLIQLQSYQDVHWNYKKKETKNLASELSSPRLMTFLQQGQTSLSYGRSQIWTEPRFQHTLSFHPNNCDCLPFSQNYIQLLLLDTHFIYFSTSCHVQWKSMKWLIRTWGNANPKTVIKRLTTLLHAGRSISKTNISWGTCVEAFGPMVLRDAVCRPWTILVRI